MNTSLCEKFDTTKIVNIFFIKIKLKTSDIMKLIDSLIDCCVKQNIKYYVERNISYTRIKHQFKMNLQKYMIQYLQSKFTLLKNIEQFIKTNNIDFFNNVKSFDDLIKKINNKNKVSFNSTIIEYSSDNLISTKLMIDDNTLTTEHIIVMCFKIFLLNVDFENDLNKHILSMCVNICHMV